MFKKTGWIAALALTLGWMVGCGEAPQRDAPVGEASAREGALGRSVAATPTQPHTLRAGAAPLWPAEAYGVEGRARLVGAVGPHQLLVMDDAVQLKQLLVGEDGQPVLSSLTWRLPGVGEAAPVFSQGPVGRLVLGDDPSRWREGVELFAGVRWEGLLPGVDLLVEPAAESIKATWWVAPGAKADGFTWSYDEAWAVTEEEGGALHVHTALGVWVEEAPVAWYGDTREPVEVLWRVEAGNRVGFAAPGRDASRPLVIDPGPTFVSALSGSEFDHLAALLPMEDGGVILVGATSDPQLQGGATSTSRNGFARRIAADGALRWAQGFGATTDTGRVSRCVTPGADGRCLEWERSPVGFGGPEQVLAADHGQVLVSRDEAIVAEEIVAVVGSTIGTDFPVVNGVQTALAGDPASIVPLSDGFVYTFSPETGAPVMSTYFGGAGRDEIRAVAVVPGSEGIFIGGRTTSPNLRVPGWSAVEGESDGFWAGVSAVDGASRSGQQVGGLSFDSVEQIAVDARDPARLGVAIVGDSSSARFSEALVPSLIARDIQFGSSSFLLTSTFTAQADPQQPFAPTWAVRWFDGDGVFASDIAAVPGGWAVVGDSGFPGQGADLGCAEVQGTCHPSGEAGCGTHTFSPTTSGFLALFNQAGVCSHFHWVAGSDQDGLDAVWADSQGRLAFIGVTRSADVTAFTSAWPDLRGAPRGDADLLLGLTTPATGAGFQDPDPVTMLLRWGSPDDTARDGDRPGERGRVIAGRDGALLWLGATSTGSARELGGALREALPLAALQGRELVAQFDPKQSGLSVTYGQVPQAVNAVGDRFTLTVVVENSGPEAALFQVNQHLPRHDAQQNFGDATPRALPQGCRVFAGEIVQCSDLTLGRGERLEIDFEFEATRAGYAAFEVRLSPDTPDLTAEDDVATARVPIALPLLTAETLPRLDDTTVGLEARPLGVRVTNRGGGDAPASTVTLRREGGPLRFQFTDRDIESCRFAEGDTALECDVPPLAIDQSHTLPTAGTLVLTPDPVTLLEQQATFDEDLALRTEVTVNNELVRFTSRESFKAELPDLEIARATLAPERAEPGDTVTLTLRVQNLGPGAAATPRFTVTLPDPTRLQLGESSPDACTSITSAQIVCLPNADGGFTLAAGEGWAVEVPLTVRDGAEAGAQQIGVKVEHIGVGERILNLKDPRPANNEASAELLISPVDLVVRVPETLPEGGAEETQTLTYQVELGEGSSSVEGATLIHRVEAVGDGIADLIGVTVAGQPCPAPQGTAPPEIRCEGIDLSPSASVEVVARFTHDARGFVQHTITADSDNPEDHPEDNVARPRTRTRGPDLRVVASVRPSEGGRIYVGDAVNVDAAVERVSGPRPAVWALRALKNLPADGRERLTLSDSDPLSFDDPWTCLQAPNAQTLFSCEAGMAGEVERLDGLIGFEAERPGAFSITLTAPVAAGDEDPTNNAATLTGEVVGPDLRLTVDTPELMGVTALSPRKDASFVAHVESHNRAWRALPFLIMRPVRAETGSFDLTPPPGCMPSEDGTFRCPLPSGSSGDEPTPLDSLEFRIQPNHGRKPIKLRFDVVHGFPGEVTTAATRTITFPTKGPDLNVTGRDRTPPGQVAEGETVTTTFEVENTSPDVEAEVESLRVYLERDPGPPRDPLRITGATFQGAPCALAGDAWSCPGATLAPSTRGQLVVTAFAVETGRATIHASARSKDNEDDTVNNASFETVEVVGPDLTVLTSFSPNPLGLGETGTLTVTVNSSGQSPAESVTVNVRSPAEKADIQSASSPTGSCSVSSVTSASCTFSALSPGDTATITLEVLALEVGDLNGLVEVTSPDLVTPIQEAWRAEARGADLAIRNVTGPTDVDLQDEVDLTFEIANQSQVNVTDAVLLNIVMTPDSIFDQPLVTSIASCTYLLPIIQCTIPAIALEAGEHEEVSLEFIAADAGLATVLVEVTELNSDNDPDLSNNRLSRQVNVAGVDVSVSAIATPQTLEPNDTAVVSVTVVNNSQKDALEVVSEFTVPPGVLVLSVTSPSGLTCYDLRAQVQCGTPRLAAGAAATWEVTLISQQRATLLVNARATGDTTPANNVVAVDLNVNERDTDGDGADDRAEGTGDANNDGLTDANDANTLTIPTTLGEQLTVISDLGRFRGGTWRPLPPGGGSGGGGSGGAALPTAGPPGRYLTTEGAVSFSIIDLDDGASVTLEALMPPGAPAGEVWWWGTPGGGEGAWGALQATSAAGASTLTLTDGGAGDADGAADGVIVTTLAPALPSWVVDEATDADDASPGDGVCATGGGGCSLRAAMSETIALGEPRAIVVEVPNDGVNRTSVFTVTSLPTITVPMVIDAAPTRFADGSPGFELVGDWGALPWLIDVVADHTTVRGLRLEPRTDLSLDPTGGLRVIASRVMIRDMLTGVGKQPMRLEGSEVVVRGGLHAESRVFGDDNRWEGVAVRAAVYVEGANNLEVRGCAFIDGDGLILDGADGAVITGSTFGLEADGTCDTFEFDVPPLRVGLCSLSSGVEFRGGGVHHVGGPLPEDRNVFARGGIQVRDFEGDLEIGGNWFGLMPDGTCLPHPEEDYCRVYSNPLYVLRSSGVRFGSDEAPNLIGVTGQLLGMTIGSSDVIVDEARHGIPARGMRSWVYGTLGQFAGVNITPASPNVVLEEDARDAVVRDSDVTSVIVEGTGHVLERLSAGYTQAGPYDSSSSLIAIGGEGVTLRDSHVCGRVAVGNATHATISNNQISNTTDRGVECFRLPSDNTDTAAISITSNNFQRSDGVVIEDNTLFGMPVGLYAGPDTLNVTARRNRIGLLEDGTPAPNNVRGVHLQGVIGAELTDNVIAGHSGSAVQLDWTFTNNGVAYTEEVTLLGNWIGVLPDGTVLPRVEGDDHGVTAYLVTGQLGDGTAGGENVIAGRAGWGFGLGGVDAARTRIMARRNRIYDNGGLAIDLAADGSVLGVDANDADGGANGSQNAPTLALSEGSLTVNLSSAPDTTYTIDLYGVAVRDPRNSGPADVWLGAAEVVTGPDGQGTVVIDAPALPEGIAALTATATGPDGTSELSAAACDGDCPAQVDLTVVAGLTPDVLSGGSTSTNVQVRNVATTGTAQDVTLTIRPEGCARVTLPIGGIGCGPVTDEGVTCALPDLPPNASVNVLIEVTCADPVGVATVAAAVSTTTTDADLSNNQVSASTRFGAADLLVGVTEAPAAMEVGATAPVTVAVRNVTAFGAPLVEGVAAVVTLPPQLTFEGSEDGCEARGSEVTCPLPPIAHLTTQLATFTVRAVAPGDGTIEGTWAGAVLDTNADNDRDAEAVTVTGEATPSGADLGVTLTAPDDWSPGAPLEVTATVTNAGPDASGAAAIRWQTPAPSVFTALDPRCVAGLTEVICLLDAVAASASTTVTVSVAPTEVPAVVRACVVGDTADPNDANDCAQLERDGDARDLGVSLTWSDPLEVGTPASLTVGLTNAGAPAANVEVAVALTGPALPTDLPDGCLPSASGVTCAFAALNGGAAIERTLPVTLLGAGPLEATATADAPGPDANLADNTATAAALARWPTRCPDGTTPTPLTPSARSPQASGGDLAWASTPSGWALNGSSGEATLPLVADLTLPGGTVAVDVGVLHRFDLGEGAVGRAELTTGGVPSDAAFWDLGYTAEDGWRGAAAGESRLQVATPASPLSLSLVASADGDAATWEVQGARVTACVATGAAPLTLTSDLPTWLDVGDVEVASLTVTHTGPDAAQALRVTWSAAPGLTLEGVGGPGMDCDTSCDDGGCVARCVGERLAAEEAVTLTAFVTGAVEGDHAVTARASSAISAEVTDAARVGVGDVPPRLTWEGAPSALTPGEVATLTLRVVDPRDRDAVSIGVDAEGGAVTALEGVSCAEGACALTGASPERSVTVTARAGAVGELRLTARSDGAEALTTIPILASDVTLALAMETEPDEGGEAAVVGEPVAVTLTVTPSDVARQATLTLGDGTEVAPVSADDRCAARSGRLVCALGSLSAATTVQAAVTPAAPGLLPLLATARAAGDALATANTALRVVGACPEAGCDDGNPCTEDTCDPTLGCVATPRDGACTTDAASCAWPGVCVAGACVAVNPCDDGVACTEDACVDGRCESVTAPDGAPCSGEGCSLEAYCVEGACMRFSERACDDGDPCTEDACDDGCVFTPLDTPECRLCDEPGEVVACEGGALVTRDACGNVLMREGCDDDDPCTRDTCDPAAGCGHAPVDAPGCGDDCAPARATTACVDGDLVWLDGCGEPGEVAVSCDDGVACTEDACDDDALVCVHVAAEGCEPVACDGAWSTACDEEGVAVVVDPCGRLAGVAPGAAPSSPCEVVTCDPERGAWLAQLAPDRACVPGDCEEGAPTLSCSDEGLVATDACGAPRGVVLACEPDAVCDEEAPGCARPLVAPEWPATEGGREADAGDVGPDVLDTGDTGEVDASPDTTGEDTGVAPDVPDVAADAVGDDSGVEVTASGDSDGCGCRAASPQRGGAWGWLAALALMGLVARRRV